MTAFTLIRDILKHPANQPHPSKTLGKAILWQMKKRLNSKTYDLDYHGIKLRCPADNHSASRAIYFSGYPDYAEMKFMEDYLRPGDSFIDGGANMGLYTLLARSLVGESGHIYAFEPNSKVAEVLRESIHINKFENISVYENGVGDANGVVFFSLSDEDCTSHVLAENPSGNEGKISIVRLDEKLEVIPYAMAKFDIEGYEPFAFRGMSKWTSKGNPAVVLLEVAGYSNRHGITTSDFISELHQNGYFTAVYDPDKRILIRTSRPWEMKVENILAIAESREDFVMGRLSGKSS
jgi:FkbM family methyltransferase